MLYTAERVFELMNLHGSRMQPFLFGIDFEVMHGFFINPTLAGNSGIYFNINGIGNTIESESETETVNLVKHPVDGITYNKAFKHVYQNLVEGNSYLTNLTFPTDIELNISLPEIFARSKARYRLLFQDEFVVFSPEIFVQIDNGTIRSFPMKGTIDASLPDAENRILADPKETAEHNTIVDLIRNDLSMVATDVKVDRFRYIEKIATNEKSLLQVSSEISGILPQNYQTGLGNIFRKLLPAGSVSGAPKNKTLQIIHEAEIYSRGFYTGVFGYFDGSKLDSGVMIRFIKKENEKLIFCSGGGITANSNPQTEYNELIDKVYVPII
ncbi:MAG: aminodeoxychorismate synthase component I [Bacteroidales bacterium]|nr:aminodeoxychorismate synthase component I [Bacteroidales bacterium]